MFLTDIDKARLEHIKNFPELILDIGQWTTVAVCNSCLNEIPIGHRCMESLILHATTGWRDYRCPHCHAHGMIKRENTSGIEVNPVPHTKYRKRFIVTSRTKRGWFKKPVESGIWEIEAIPKKVLDKEVKGGV